MLFMATYMIFLTNARTAVVIYLGEVFMLVVLCVWGRFPLWKGILLKIIAITVISFGITIVANSYFHNNNQSWIVNSANYVSNNITSINSVEKRSNMARIGNTIASVMVGLEHPVFGVGRGYQGMYMKNNFPDFAKDDKEIKKWTADMELKTPFVSGYPVLNQYAAIFMWNGILGLVLFLVPILYVIRFVIKYKQILSDFDFSCISIMVIGQLACMLSNEFFYTYPISLSLAYCYIEYWKTNKLDR